VPATLHGTNRLNTSAAPPSAAPLPPGVGMKYSRNMKVACARIHAGYHTGKPRAHIMHGITDNWVRICKKATIKLAMK